MMKITRNALIFSAVTCLLALGAYAFIFLQAKATAQEHAQIAAEIEREEQKQEQFGSVSEILSSTKEEREELGSVFVTDETFVDFFEEFEVLRTEAGVEASIDQVREEIALDLEEEEEEGEDEDSDDQESSNVSAAEILEYAELDVSVEGRWENVFRFLSLIETMPYAMELRNVHTRELESQQPQTENEDGETVDQTPSRWSLTFTIRVLKYK